MDADSCRKRLLPVASEIIRKKARSLASRQGYAPDDADDIAQDLFLDLLQRASAFDPAKGNERQFVCTIVNRCIATMIEARQAAKRGWGALVICLDDDTGVDDARSRHEAITDEDVAVGSRSNRESRDLAIDLTRALDTLPPDLGHLAKQLLMGRTPTEIARASGIPRTTVSDRVAQLRRHLRQTGISDYLKFPPSDRRRFR